MAEMLASFDFYFCRWFAFGLVFCNVVSLFLQILLSMTLLSGLSWGWGAAINQVVPFFGHLGITDLGTVSCMKYSEDHRDIACISLICQKPTPNPNLQNSSSRKSNPELAGLTTASRSLENLSTVFVSASLPWHLENHTWLNIELKRSQTHYSHSFFALWTHSFI